tara:strand:- start:99 stop:524 length:426 start_codon:yes stop_codon:yes gene_type:complete
MAVTKKFTANLSFSSQNVFPTALSLSEGMTVTVDGDSANSGSLKVTSSVQVPICTSGTEGQGLDAGSRAFVLVKNVGTNDDGDIEVEGEDNDRIMYLKAGEWAFFPFMMVGSAVSSVNITGASATAGYCEYIVIETTTTDY